jgi:hypothetical protein
MNLKYEPMARGSAQAFSDSSCLVFCLNHDTCSCIRDRTSNVDVVRLPSDAEFQEFHFVSEVQLASWEQHIFIIF